MATITILSGNNTVISMQYQLKHVSVSQGTPGSDGPPGRDGATGVKVRDFSLALKPETSATNHTVLQKDMRYSGLYKL